MRKGKRPKTHLELHPLPWTTEVEILDGQEVVFFKDAAGVNVMWLPGKYSTDPVCTDHVTEIILETANELSRLRAKEALWEGEK